MEDCCVTSQNPPDTQKTADQLAERSVLPNQCSRLANAVAAGISCEAGSKQSTCCESPNLGAWRSIQNRGSADMLIQAWTSSIKKHAIILVRVSKAIALTVYS